MLRTPYGKDWTYVYYPPDDPDFTPLASTSPSVYIFSTRPSESTARSGTGALQTISTWSEYGNPIRRELAVTTITDPQDGTKEAVYWIAVNYLLKTSGQKQLDLQSFILVTPDGFYADPTPSVEYIKGISSSIGSYYVDSNIEAYSKLGLSQLKKQLKAKGFEWAQIENRDDLKLAIAYKALSLMMLEQISESGDRFSKRYDEYKASYDTLILSFGVDYDANKDGQITTGEKSKQTSGVTYLTR